MQGDREAECDHERCVFFSSRRRHTRSLCDWSSDVCSSDLFVMGPAVGQLELEIARLAQAQHGIACASGTDALLLPLKALQLRPGDEVITTPFTFFATAGTIHNAGGTPVFVDIEPDTFNLDPTRVAGAI